MSRTFKEENEIEFLQKLLEDNGIRYRQLLIRKLEPGEENEEFRAYALNIVISNYKQMLEAFIKAER